MTVPFRIGVLQLSMEPMEETLTMAQACDAAGFDSFGSPKHTRGGANIRWKLVRRLR